MAISIVIPAYNRPKTLAEALASIAIQDLTLIGEVLIGDDSSEDMRELNRAAIAASSIAHLIRYIPNNPRRGNFPNHHFLGDCARGELMVILHDDDVLMPGALASLYAAFAGEQDDRVKVWFGRNLMMDEHSRINQEQSDAMNKHFGTDGPEATKPLWQWVLSESVHPNSFLIDRDTYNRYKKGARDEGNMGDWGMWVRLSNAGVWAHFIARDTSVYRDHTNNETGSGRGVDVHRWLEVSEQLQVPPECLAEKHRRISGRARVATVRYVRDGQRIAAWKCFVSPYWTWRQRLSLRGCATLAMLLTPKKIWNWALRYR